MTNEERRQEVKNEKARQKKGDLKVKAVKYSYGCPIIKFEKRCFGWHYVGHTVDEDVSYDVVKTSTCEKLKKNTKIIKYAYFNRPKVWKKNFLFGLTEFIANFLGFFRRILIGLAPIQIIIGIILIAADAAEGALILGIVNAALIAAAFVFGGLGFLWKKVFKLEEKTDEVLTANGFDVWSANEEGETID